MEVIPHDKQIYVRYRLANGLEIVDQAQAMKEYERQQKAVVDGTAVFASEMDATDSPAPEQPAPAEEEQEETEEE